MTATGTGDRVATEESPGRSGARGLRLDRVGWLTLLVVTPMLVVLPLALAERGMDALGPPAALLTFALCTFSAIRLGWLLARGVHHLVTATFYVFVYVWLGVAAFVQIDTQRFVFIQDQLGMTFSRADQTRGAVIIWVGVIAFEAGLWVGRRRSARVAGRAPSHATLSLPRVRVLAVVGLGLGLIGVAVGGVDKLFSTRAQFSQDLESSAAAVMRLPVFVAAYLLTLLIRRSPDLSFRRLPAGTKLLYVTTIAVTLVLNNPFVTSRAQLATVIGGLGFAWLRPGQRNVFRAVILVLLWSTLVLFPIANQFRGTPGAHRQGLGIAETLIETPDFGMYSQILVGAQYVDEFGLRRGQQIGSAVFFFVPRAVWSGKAPDTGDLTHDALGVPTRFNESSPLWDEFYVDGGMFLVVAGFLAYGVGVALLERAYLRTGWRLGVLGATVPLYAAYQFFILRGSLLAAMPRLGLMLVCIVLCCSPYPVSLRRRRVRRGVESDGSTMVTVGPGADAQGSTGG